MGLDGGFITGSDFLMDGGVTAAYWYGELAPQQQEKKTQWRLHEWVSSHRRKDPPTA
jgi:hypothetical protein